MQENKRKSVKPKTDTVPKTDRKRSRKRGKTLKRDPAAAPAPRTRPRRSHTPNLHVHTRSRHRHDRVKEGVVLLRRRLGTLGLGHVGRRALTTPDGKEPFHHVARGVDNAGPGQVDSATDADCTEVEGDPPSTQVSPQALPRAAKASKAAMKKAAAAAAPDDEPVASRTRAQKAARASPP